MWAWNGSTHPNAYFAAVASSAEEKENVAGDTGTGAGTGWTGAGVGQGAGAAGAGETGGRAPVVTDWGGFVGLEDKLRAETYESKNGNGVVNGAAVVNGGGSGPSQDVLDTQAKLFDAIRKSVVDAATNGTGSGSGSGSGVAPSTVPPPAQLNGTSAGNTTRQAGKAADAGAAMHVQLGTEEGYWSERQARDAQAWLSEVVYGGVEGLALIRSLAEFVSPSGRFDVEDEDVDMDGYVVEREGKEAGEEDMVIDSTSDVKVCSKFLSIRPRSRLLTFSVT